MKESGGGGGVACFNAGSRLAVVSENFMRIGRSLRQRYAMLSASAAIRQRVANWAIEPTGIGIESYISVTGGLTLLFDHEDAQRFNSVSKISSQILKLVRFILISSFKIARIYSREIFRAARMFWILVCSHTAF